MIGKCEQSSKCYFIVIWTFSFQTSACDIETHLRTLVIDFFPVVHIKISVGFQPENLVMFTSFNIFSNHDKWRPLWTSGSPTTPLWVFNLQGTRSADELNSSEMKFFHCRRAPHQSSVKPVAIAFIFLINKSSLRAWFAKKNLICI